MKVELLSIDAIKATLQGYWRVSVKDEVSSTMNEINKSDTQFWDLVVAEFQSDGRGRVERKFDSPKHCGLLFSFYIEPNRDKKDWGFISLLAGKVVAQTLQELAPQCEFKTKWPNDVLVAGKKIAGLLVETHNSGVIIGIGINISTSQTELPVPTATSLFLESNQVFDRNLVLSKILNKFREVFITWDGGGNFVNGYIASSATIGASVKVQLPGDKELTGKAIGISQSGTLILDGDREVTVGDVIHLEPLK